MKILILGHKGMLGRTVQKFFTRQDKFETLTVNARFGDPEFETNIIKTEADFIINCIGKIPQKQPTPQDYTQVNTELPRFLDTLNISTILPTTDCEFKGDIPAGESYTKSSPRDADDDYGLSKAIISKEIEENSKNTKIIRTSIIGHEEATTLALLDWFLSQSGSVRGYTNHYWNGITTLEWAKQCQKIIENWSDFPTLNQLGTTKHYSKFNIISMAKDIYKKDIEITPFATEQAVNKCLASDTILPELDVQLAELKEFFKK